jgi:hypothetical protein
MPDMEGLHIRHIRQIGHMYGLTTLLMEYVLLSGLKAVPVTCQYASGLLTHHDQLALRLAGSLRLHVSILEVYYNSVQLLCQISESKNANLKFRKS